MVLLIPGAESRQLKAVLMWPPPNPQVVLDSGASYLFDPQLFSAQVGWVAGVEDSFGDYCILMHESDFSLVSELPGCWWMIK